MALEMKTSCELCREPLSNDDAWICSFECTYCPGCHASLTECPNCAGELVRRPRRAKNTVAAANIARRLPNRVGRIARRSRG